MAFVGHPQLQQHLQGFGTDDNDGCSQEDAIHKINKQQEQNEKQESSYVKKYCFNNLAERWSVLLIILLASSSSIQIVFFFYPIVWRRETTTTTTTMKETLVSILITCLLQALAFGLGRIWFSWKDKRRCDDIKLKQKEEESLQPQNFDTGMHFLHVVSCIQTALGCIQAPPLALATDTVSSSWSQGHMKRQEECILPLVQHHVQYLKVAHETIQTLAQVSAWPFRAAATITLQQLSKREGGEQRFFLPGKRWRGILWQQLATQRQALENLEMLLLPNDQKDGSDNLDKNDNSITNEQPILTLAILRQAWLELRDTLSSVAQQLILRLQTDSADNNHTQEHFLVVVQQVSQQVILARAYLESWRRIGQEESVTTTLSSSPRLRDLAQTQQMLEHLNVGLQRLSHTQNDDSDANTISNINEWESFRLCFDKLSSQVDQLEEAHYSTRADENEESLRIEDGTNDDQQNSSRQTGQKEFVSISQDRMTLQDPLPPPVPSYDPTSTLVFSGKGQREKVTKKNKTRHRPNQQTTIPRPAVDPMITELNLVVELRRRLANMPVLPEIHVAMDPVEEKEALRGEGKQEKVATKPMSETETLTSVKLVATNSKKGRKETEIIKEETSFLYPHSADTLVVKELATAIQLRQSLQESHVLE